MYVPIEKYKRNPDKFKTNILNRNKKTWSVKEDCKILIPSRFKNRGLLVIDDVVKVISIYALLDEVGNYTVCNAPCIQEVTPYDIQDTSINDTGYIVLIFKKDTVMIPNTSIVKQEYFIYDLFDEFFIKGNVPWYMDYDDLSLIFLLAKEYAGSNIGANLAAMELITSIIARTPDDRKAYFRTKIGADKKYDKKPEYVPMLSPESSFKNVPPRIIGSYLERGITTSLVHKTTNLEKLDEVLRK